MNHFLSLLTFAISECRSRSSSRSTKRYGQSGGDVLADAIFFVACCRVGSRSLPLEAYARKADFEPDE